MHPRINIIRRKVNKQSTRENLSIHFDIRGRLFFLAGVFIHDPQMFSRVSICQRLAFFSFPRSFGTGQTFLIGVVKTIWWWKCLGRRRANEGIYTRPRKEVFRGKMLAGLF